MTQSSEQCHIIIMPQAMFYMYTGSYGGVSFNPLRHVQTGNIYIVSEEECRLGGYENTLLGYRTRLYRKVVESNLNASIDVHVW